MQIVSAEFEMFSHEKGVILGGSPQYFELMSKELSQIRETIKLKRIHGHELPPQNRPKEYRPCKAVLYGCKNMIDVRAGVQYCSDHAHGKGCPQPGRHKYRVWTRYKKFFALWLREQGVRCKVIADIMGVNGSSVSHAIDEMRKALGEPQRGYRQGVR